jgi:hypothetical protein
VGVGRYTNRIPEWLMRQPLSNEGRPLQASERPVIAAMGPPHRV